VKQEVAQEAVKAAPPVAVAGAHYFLGMALSDWVLFATLIYTALLTLRLLWKWWKEIRA